MSKPIFYVKENDTETINKYKSCGFKIVIIKEDDNNTDIESALQDIVKHHLP